MTPPVAAQSTDFERTAPKEPIPSVKGDIITQDAAAPAAPDAVMVGSLRGLVLLGDAAAVRAGGRTETGIQLEDLPLPGDGNLRQRLEPFLGQPVSVRLLDQVTAEIVSFYRGHDYLVVDALAPTGQDISDGVVQVVVLFGRRGELRVEGAKHFSADRLAQSFRVSPGETLLESRLLQELDWLNNNPFRSVDVLLERGATLGETDVVLDVTDRRPFRVYAGVEDSGTDLTGERRWLLGFNWGNAFGLDHRFNYQYTSAFDQDDLNAHSMSYVAPLPWRHTLTLFGDYVTSEPGVDAAGFRLDGESWQVGLRYAVPLPRWGGLNHNAVFGYDFKRANNDLEFGGLRVFDVFTEVSQFTVGYSGALDDALGSTSVAATLFLSPGGLSDDNEDSNFAASRAGASADYSYFHLSLDRVTRLPRDFSWLVEVTLQAASDNLIGSEILGLGGYRSVRGYDEYQAAGDQGIIVRNELRAPPFSIEPGKDQMQLLFFIDYGIVESADPLPGENSTDLLSAGVGLRYSIAPYLTLRFDYGWQLEEPARGIDRSSRMHGGLVIAF